LACYTSFGQLATHTLYSTHLGDTITYYTYTSRPTDMGKLTMPAETQHWVYVLDGKKMLDNGMLQALQANPQVQSMQATYVFVSSIVHQHNPVDKRNAYFTCNPNYLAFFESELVPKVESHRQAGQKRMLIGASFGGMCGAYFAAKTHLFTHYALLSPITYLCADLPTRIAFSANRGLGIYISTGKYDAEQYVGSLINSFKAQHHHVVQKSTTGGHNMANWLGQIDDIFTFFAAP